MQADLIWTPWNPMIEIGFWTTLAKKKLQEYKLEADEKDYIGRYTIAQAPEETAFFNLDAFSFHELEEEKMGPVAIKIPGKFLNTNTIEQFKQINLEQEEEKLIAQDLQAIKAFIEGKSKAFNPATKLLTFADLKKYLYSFYFLAAAPGVKGYETLNIQPLKDKKDLHDSLNAILKAYFIKVDRTQRLVIVRKDNNSDYALSSIKQFIDEPAFEYLFVYLDTLSGPTRTSIHTSSLLALFALLKSSYNVPAERLQRIKIFVMKDFMVYNLQKNSNFRNSILWTLNLSNIELDPASNKKHPKKLTQMDLKNFQDERRLARDAVDLNIKLMKWRMLPRLDIPKIQSRKCLLFGAGTLGCQLARNLIGWGIKHITFIDYSNVSYSNPVRQSLYEYQDSIKGGRPKALVAAQKLKKIYPDIEATGYHISVPMPGHFVVTEKQIEESFKNLEIIENLVKVHDVSFLLLDSREARWLPTVLSNLYDKACITVGLGFDSFLVVRHGVTPLLYDPVYHKERLSCYFCNDITAPQNSMKDRTLDQMCTVTRPGLSFASSAYAAELYISLIHHDLEHRVWADEDSTKLQTTDLGKLPHHVRGSMGDFDINMFYGRAFDQCVACSKQVLNEYTNHKQEFMLSVMNDPKYLHSVTGMDALIREMEENAAIDFIEILDDEDNDMMIIQGSQKNQNNQTEQSNHQSNKP